MREARRLAKLARAKARGRGAKGKLKAPAKLEQLADRCEKVASQITKRVKGEPISDRIVSLTDPDARPIRKGKLGKPNENTLLPDTIAELKRLQISPREVALDGGFMSGPTSEALEDLTPERVFISGRQEHG